jgi:soluble lytic murein transglycosylase-like protein
VVEIAPSFYQGVGTNWEQWRPLVAEHFPGELTSTAVCLLRHESGGNPKAKNPTSSARGLFQIMASVWAPTFGVSYDSLYDPELNVALARRIYDIQGWGAWSPWNRGLCRG